VYATDAISPDGKRIAVVRHTSKGEYLEIGPTGGHGPWQRIYRSSYYLNTDLYWATPNLIAFGDSNIETNTIDVRTHRVHFRLATATSFNVSNDGRWIAWSWAGAPDAPATVGVVPITGGACLVPPRPANREDTLAFFRPGVKRLYFLRGPWSVRGHVEGATRIISVPWSSLRRDSVRVCQRG
jgi:hypothetical protein